MIYDSVIANILLLIGFGVLVLFAITGIISAYDEVKKDKERASQRNFDEHFKTIIRD